MNYRQELGYIDAFLDQSYTLVPKKAELLAILRKLYEQQHYMHTSKSHKVEDCNVSISELFTRTVVRGISESNWI